MQEAYSVIARSGALRLYKDDAAGRRDRMVRVQVAGARPRTMPFPAGFDSIDIEDLPPAAAVTLSVHHAQPLRRLLQAPVVLSARPQPCRLRGLITGSGRCGTQSLAQWLDGMAGPDGPPVKARHETLARHLLPMIAAGRVEDVRMFVAGFAHDIECAPHFSLLPAAIDADTVIRVVRDGRRVVQSGLNRGWYANQGPWNRVKPSFPGDIFDRCCRFWVHTNRNLDGVATRTFRLEDLTASAGTRGAFLAALGLPPSDRSLPAANAGRVSSRPDGWSAAQSATFARICGPLMDEHYPGWREDGTGPVACG